VNTLGTLLAGFHPHDGQIDFTRQDFAQELVGGEVPIAERYVAGETMAELARDYGVGEATVWRVLSTA
jgi:hypothetical protein